MILLNIKYTAQQQNVIIVLSGSYYNILGSHTNKLILYNRIQWSIMD